MNKLYKKKYSNNIALQTDKTMTPGYVVNTVCYPICWQHSEKYEIPPKSSQLAAWSLANLTRLDAEVYRASISYQLPNIVNRLKQ